MKILKHPLTIIGGMFAGIILGIYFPQSAPLLAPFGEIFISLLKMCVLPIVIAITVASFAKVFMSGRGIVLFRHTLLILFIGLAVAGVGGLLTGKAAADFLLKNGELQQALSSLMGETKESQGISGFSQLLITLIPQNIFKSLSEGQILGCLFFFILFGVAVGKKSRSKDRLIAASMETVNEALFLMLDWIFYLLPLGVCAIFAGTFARLGGSSFAVLSRMAAVYSLGLVSLLLVQSAAMFLFLKPGNRKNLLSLKKPFLVALSTCSSLAAIPTALKTLQDELKLSKLATELALPLGATIGPQVNIFFFAFVSVFVARIYGLDVGLNELAIIMSASFFQSISSAGLPVMASLAMLSSLLGPVGIPAETVMVLFWAIVPLLDPLETVINVSGYCAVAVVVDKTGDFSGC